MQKKLRHEKEIDRAVVVNFMAVITIIGLVVGIVAFFFYMLCYALDSGATL